MSLNPLKIATRGYLKRNTKAVLIIAVAGYLNYGSGGGVSPDDRNPITSSYEDAGGRRQTELELELAKKKRLIEEDEDQWMIFVAAFIKTL